ncbi:hypothetical protein AVEN_62583-1 [Araneus ventricosus]|uniref:Uncharacterized protein n=1 Tax=Araneus ventricosus TaxID=182803 RepID=A0A4Y2U8E5_ARAVE|nr:hypothetical protein AVEN_256632-1 [Araneus ventricosus]GBO09078.1 hypothetical protein AVEN_62583-1 [Araneus ventricosus]
MIVQKKLHKPLFDDSGKFDKNVSWNCENPAQASIEIYLLRLHVLEVCWEAMLKFVPRKKQEQEMQLSLTARAMVTKVTDSSCLVHFLAIIFLGF